MLHRFPQLKSGWACGNRGFWKTVAVWGKEPSIKSAKSAGRLTTVPSKCPNTALIDCSWTGHSWGNSLSWQLCCWWWKGPWLGRTGFTVCVCGGPCLFMELALCWECPKGSHPSQHRWNASVKTRENKKIYFNKSLIAVEPSQATSLCQCKIKENWCCGPHSISDMHRHVPCTKPALLLFVNPLCRQRMGVEQVFPYFHSLHIPLG